MKHSSSARPLEFLAQAGAIGGLYAAMCLLIRFGPFRPAEMLTVLPVYLPAAVPGLTLGCLITNLLAGAGAWDWLIGTLATLAAAVISRLLRRVRWHGLPVLSVWPPVLINAVAVGAELACLAGDGFSWPAFALAAAGVAAAETVSCVGGGLLLAAVLERRGFLGESAEHHAS